MFKKLFILFIFSHFFGFSLTKVSFSEEKLEEEVYEIVGNEIKSPQGKEGLVNEGLSGNVKLGAGSATLSRETFKFGEYTGIDDNGGYPIGEAELSYIYQTYYLNFWVDNLGLDNRNLFLEAGQTSNYTIYAEYDQNPHLLFSQNLTPFTGGGSAQLSINPALAKLTITPATITVPAVPNVISNSNNLDLQIDDRNTTRFGFSKIFGKKSWTVEYKRINKDGIQSLGGVVGNHPANPHSTILPVPVDQVTNEMLASFAYSGKKVQLQVDYLLSLNDNRKESVLFESPYAGTVGFFDRVSPFTVGALPFQGRVSREPDHQFHRLSFTGGVNLSPTTRISATAEYSFSYQDEELLPYSLTTNTNLLPRNTAEAKMHILHFTLQANSRLNSKINLKAKFRHYQTINKTPKTLFMPVINDTGAQVLPADDAALFNLPYEYIQDQIQLEGTYKLFRATSLKLGYELEIYDRSFRAVEDTIENIFKISMFSNYLSHITTNLSLSFSTKSGSAYDATQVTNSRHTSAFLTSPTAVLLAKLPDLRRFDIADRDRYKFGWNLSLMATEFLVFGLNYQLHIDNFTDGVLGLRDALNQAITIDVNYAFQEQGSFFAFFTFNNWKKEQMGRAHNFGIPGSRSNPNFNWQLETNDKSYTAGSGAHFSFLKNRLTWDLEYTFTSSNSGFNFIAGSALSSPQGLPNLKTTLHSFTTKSEYKITKKFLVGLSYLYENFENNDFALNQFEPLDILLGSPAGGRVLLLSRAIQDYEAHLAMLYFIYRIGD